MTYRHYICDECANRYGGEWPKGHRATKHEGDCDYCGHRHKMLASITDWSWPARAVVGELTPQKKEG